MIKWDERTERLVEKLVKNDGRIEHILLQIKSSYEVIEKIKELDVEGNIELKNAHKIAESIHSKRLVEKLGKLNMKVCVKSGKVILIGRKNPQKQEIEHMINKANLSEENKIKLQKIIDDIYNRSCMSALNTFKSMKK